MVLARAHLFHFEHVSQIAPKPPQNSCRFSGGVHRQRSGGRGALDIRSQGDAKFRQHDCADVEF
jgi:hypothetical protein